MILDHGYYQMKIEDFKSGTDLISQHSAATSCTAKSEGLQETQQSLKEPKPFEFHLKHPPIPPLDLQIIKYVQPFTLLAMEDHLGLTLLKENRKTANLIS